MENKKIPKVGLKSMPVNGKRARNHPAENGSWENWLLYRVAVTVAEDEIKILKRKTIIAMVH